MTRTLALARKELTVLFASPVAYLVLAVVALLTAITFFEHLRLYNQILFLYASNTMGGFESDTIPTHINLRDTVFAPVMDQLSLMLVIPIPLVTMRVFAEERARGTDEWLLTSGISPGEVVLAKFAVTLLFVWGMMSIAFVYPATAVTQGGVGLSHLISVYLGLLLLAFAIACMGLACSAYSTNQIVAAATTVALAYTLYDFGWMHSLVSETMAGWLDAVSLRPRFGAFAEGIVRLADTAYFAAVCAISAAAARLSLDLRRGGA